MVSIVKELTIAELWQFSFYIFYAYSPHLQWWHHTIQIVCKFEFLFDVMWKNVSYYYLHCKKRKELIWNWRHHKYKQHMAFPHCVKVNYSWEFVRNIQCYWVILEQRVQILRQWLLHVQFNAFHFSFWAWDRVLFAGATSMWMQSCEWGSASRVWEEGKRVQSPPRWLVRGVSLLCNPSSAPWMEGAYVPGSTMTQTCCQAHAGLNTSKKCDFTRLPNFRSLYYNNKFCLA